MMAIVIISFIIGYPILAILSLPVFLSALMGVSFKSNSKATKGTIKIANRPNIQIVAQKQLSKVA